MTAAAPLVLLTGIPASGKSTYGRWLAANKDFLYIDLEHGAPESEVWAAIWGDVLAGEASAAYFISTVACKNRAVVLDWGFLPQYLPIVRALQLAGAEMWWF